MPFDTAGRVEREEDILTLRRKAEVLAGIGFHFGLENSQVNTARNDRSGDAFCYLAAGNDDGICPPASKPGYERLDPSQQPVTSMNCDNEGGRVTEQRRDPGHSIVRVYD